MVKEYKCSFCGHPIEPGTGTTYVTRDEKVYRFCSRKCRRSMLDFKRDPRKLKWTTKYEPKFPKPVKSEAS